METSLRILASRERARRLSRRTVGQAWAAWAQRFKFSVAHLMRPLALPLAGGVTSAVVLFSMLVPSYPMPVPGSFDVPTVLSTEVTVKGMAPIGIPGGEVVVDVVVDDQGRLIDYTIVSPHSAMHNAWLRRSIENNLLFAQFTPATAFGQPTAGRIRVSFRSSHIEVKG